MFRRLTALLTASSILASATAVVPTGRATAHSFCTPVYVVQAAGTGYSSRTQTPNPLPLYISGWNPTDELQRRFGIRNVAGFNVSYPASLGRVSTFTPNPNGNEAATYGESVLAGVEEATSEMTRVARACPETSFFLVGYSQGASVAGDAAAEIAAGRVADVSPERIGGVILIADPGRSPTVEKPSEEASAQAAANSGVPAANGEIIVGGNTGVLPGRVGMTGARPTPFTGLEGRVISLCNSNDMACSIHEGSLIRDVADYANRVEWPGPSDTFTAETIARLKAELDSGVPLEEALVNADFNWLSIISIISALMEVAGYLRIVIDHTRPDLSFFQLVALSVIAAAPGLVAKGNTAEYLLPAADGLAGQVATFSPEASATITLVAESMRLVFTAEQPFQAPGDARAAATRRDVTSLGTVIADRTGLTPLLKDPANTNLIGSMAVAGDFGFAHISYFDDHFMVEDKNGTDLADEWLASRVSGFVGPVNGSS